MTNHRQLHFNAFLMSCEHHEAAWWLKDSNPFANLDLGHWTKLAHLAERGTFDSVFLADAPALWGNAGTEYTGTTLRDHYGLPRPESQFAERNAS